MRDPTREYRLRYYEVTPDALIDASQLHTSGIYRLVSIAVAMIVGAAVIIAAIALAFPGLDWLSG